MTTSDGTTIREPETVDEKLLRLVELPPNWDGYHAKPITIEAVETARRMLSGAPIVPLPGGGIQIEWHLDGHEVEITIAPNGKIEEVWSVSHGL